MSRILSIKEDHEERRRKDKVQCIKEPVVINASDAALMISELTTLVGGTQRQWMVDLLTRGSTEFRD
jgi:hypothetical protein